MSDLNTEGAAGVSEHDPISIIDAPTDMGEDTSVSDAARALARARYRKPEQAAGEQREDTQPSGADESTAQAGDAAPPEMEATGETQDADPADRPPIEPPRSWNAEARERWSKLDPDTQQYLLQRDSEDSAAVRKAQNEAADKLKGLTVKEQAVDQARQQYEAALPQLLTMLQAQQAGEFADIKTLADVERLAREDWPRYALWDVQQKKIAEVAQQLNVVQHRQALEKQQQFTDFAKREDDLFKEKVPDMADDKKAAELQTRCLATLTGLGFAEADLAASWNGQKDLSLRDHRVQLLIRDATLWREAQAKAKAAQAKPVPPVQRPGTAPGRGEARAAEIQNLTQQLDKSSGVKALRTAARLAAARRAAR